MLVSTWGVGGAPEGVDTAIKPLTGWWDDAAELVLAEWYPEYHERTYGRAWSEQRERFLRAWAIMDLWWPRTTRWTHLAAAVAWAATDKPEVMAALREGLEPDIYTIAEHFEWPLYFTQDAIQKGRDAMARVPGLARPETSPVKTTVTVGGQALLPGLVDELVPDIDILDLPSEAVAGIGGAVGALLLLALILILAR